jgi:hypothetical protein
VNIWAPNLPAAWRAPSIRTRYIAGMTRYLRIAAAGFFALLTLALIGLWVRSYSRCDLIHSPSIGLNSFTVASNYGVFSFGADSHDLPNASTQWDFLTGPRRPPLKLVLSNGRSPGLLTRLGFIFLHNSALTMLSVPYWFLIASSCALAAVLGLKRPWRFTVRGLLIATTLLAVALGLGVALN